MPVPTSDDAEADEGEFGGINCCREPQPPPPPPPEPLPLVLQPLWTMYARFEAVASLGWKLGLSHGQLPLPLPRPLDQCRRWELVV
jgi:hypothetical protein